MTGLMFLASLAHADPLVAVVVVDEQARERGYALEIDGWLVDDPLPVDVAEGEVLKLVAPSGQAERIDLAPGEAWEVTGPDGEAWMSLLDEEIRTDLIAVRGPRKAIDALARSLDAAIVVDDDVLYLSGENILLDAAWVEDSLALQVDEVGLVRVRPHETKPEPVRPVATAPLVPVPIRTPSRVVTPTAAPASEPPPPSIAEPDPPKRRGLLRRHAPAEGPTALVAPGRVTGEDALESYAGRHMCRMQMLWLNPDGTYGFQGAVGRWRVVSPGVVRLESFEGELWWRASIEPETGFCRDVWQP